MTRLDLRVPKGFDLTSCRLWDDGAAGLQVWHSRPADKHFVLGADADGSVHVLDVGGRRQVFLAHHHDATAPSDLAELQQVLDSIRLGETPAAPGG